MSLRRVIFWLLSFVSELKGKMSLAITLGVLSSLSVMAIPVTGVLAVSALMRNDATALWPYALIMISCGVLRGVLRYFEQYLNHAVAFELLALVRDKIFGVLRELAPAKLQGKSSGDLIAMITSDVELLEVFFAHTVSPVAIAIITSIISVIFLGMIDVRLALLAALAYCVVGGWIPVWNYYQHKRAGDDYKMAVSQLNQVVVEVFSSTHEMMQYQLQAEMIEHLTQAGKEVNQKNEHMVDQGVWIQSVSEACVFLFSTMMLALSIFLKLEVAEVILSTIFMLSSFGPTLALAGLGNALLSTFASARRLYDLVNEKPVVRDISGDKQFVYTKGLVSEVSFTYPGSNQKVLNQLNLTLPQQGLVGIMGQSGLGKSTLLKLLMRFWKVNGGRIELSDTNIEQIDTEALRASQGYMEQDTLLFEDTLRFNITLGKLYDDTLILEAIAKASLMTWYRHLPEGLETKIGGKHRTLSEGERQRIGLARIFIHQASLVLLDEPTSNLDYLNEQLILTALKKEKEKRMIVLVSHRESAMEQVDQCLLFTDINQE